MTPERARTDVLYASLRVISARLWIDEHPGDPHGGDAYDYATDNLDYAIREYVACSSS